MTSFAYILLKGIYLNLIIMCHALVCDNKQCSTAPFLFVKDKAGNHTRICPNFS